MGEESACFRRTVLGRFGGLGVVGLLAGCSGGDGNGGNGTPTPTPTPAVETVTPTDGDDLTALESFLSDVSNYDEVEDRQDTDVVTVAVGAEGNGAYFAFDPAAVRVDRGTEIRWEWTGRGGTHNVTAVEGAEFQSDLADEAGFTFEWTADEAGRAFYVCEPHRGAGMKGAIVIE